MSELFADWTAHEGISATGTPFGVALELAIHGVHVFPLVGKKPDGEITPKGVHDATDDLRTVIRWFQHSPQLNVGIAIGVGALAMVRVLDVDPRHGGHERISVQTEKYGELPPTLTVETGRRDGGRHYYYAYPPGEYRTLIFGKDGGVELRGPGLYVVGPKSVHPDTGGTYEVISDPGIAWAPKWLVELARIKRRTAPKVTAPPSTDVVERARKYLAKCEPAVSGAHGHDATFLVALKLVRGFGLDVGTAYALMAHDYNPLCQPPWSERDLRRKVEQAAEHGRADEGFLRDSRRTA